MPRTVFEWGSGGSTVWLAEVLKVERLVSVEHDADWFEEVGAVMRERGLEADRRLVPPEPGEVGPDPSEPSHYRSASTEVGPGRNWRRYAGAIDGEGGFDLVLVDGMARASCLWHGASHVRPGGWLALDNTGDRPYYLAKTLHLFEGWDRVDVTGWGPILGYQWTCTLFRRTGKEWYGK
jgi:hypothetical protein